MKLFNWFGKPKHPPSRKTRRWLTRYADAPDAIGRASLLPPDAELIEALDNTKALARQEVQRSGLARSYLNVLEKHILGAKGIQVKPSDPQVNAAWLDYINNQPVDFTEQQDWLSLQRMLLSQLVVDGEIFCRLYDSPDTKYGLQMRILDSALFPASSFANNNPTAQNANTVNLAVERDANGRIVAYHVSPDPNRSTFMAGQGYSQESRTTRIEASEILHIFRKESPLMSRGISWFAPVLAAMANLREFEKTELLAARTAASVLGFIQQTGDSGGWTPPEESETPKDDIVMEHGQINYLDKDQQYQDVRSSHPNSSFSQFVRAQKETIAAGLGIAYHSLSADVTSVSFSAARTAVIAEEAFTDSVREFLVRSFYRPFYKRFVFSAIQRGQLRMPGNVSEYMQAEFLGPNVPPVQPKDYAAEKERLIALGLETPSSILRAKGLNPDQVFAEAIADHERLRPLREETSNNGGNNGAS